MSHSTVIQLKHIVSASFCKFQIVSRNLRGEVVFIRRYIHPPHTKTQLQFCNWLTLVSQRGQRLDIPPKFITVLYALTACIRYIEEVRLGLGVRAFSYTVYMVLYTEYIRGCRISWHLNAYKIQRYTKRRLLCLYLYVVPLL